MRALHRIAVAAVITAAFLPSPAHGQGATSEAPARKVDSLLARIDELEKRVAALENLLKATPARRPAADAASNPADIANWRRLRENMSMEDVRSLLGEPEKIDGGSVAVWYYPRSGRVMFFSGRLNQWQEPSR